LTVEPFVEFWSSIAQLLDERRGGRHRPVRPARPPLTEADILAWADDHIARTGARPTGRSGPVLAAPDEKWSAIDDALKQGLRGLSGGTSLSKLLDQTGRMAKRQVVRRATG
jgi:hypothetical protein